MATEPETAGLRKAALFGWVFLVAAVYDVVLGLVFFFGYSPIFDALDISVPENTSYIHISAAFVFVQGIGYWLVYRNMYRNVDIVRLGVIYKAVYTAVAVYYWAAGDLPHTVFAWFAVLDAIFLVLFVAFLANIRAAGRTPEARAR